MWPPAQDTQELLAQARSGDPGAVEQLLTRYREPVRRMIGLRLDHAIAPRVDASDIVQDVLLEASQRLGEYLRQGTMPFHLWLRHIARDHLIDAHRRHRTAQRRSVDRERSLNPAWTDDSSLHIADDLIDRELTPATAALRHEMQQRFQQVLTSLDDDDREIILMRHFEQLSNQEVAAALALSEAAAGMRHLRALRRLRALLVPESSGDSAQDR
jgi:RNA polymerase sigma-70 factor (ECF subfamily)